MSGCAGPSASQEGAVLDPSSLGVPGLKTLAAGARIEVLWQQGWEPGTVKECLLMMDTQPVIMYRVAYDDGESMVDDLRKLSVRRRPDATEDAEVQCTNEHGRESDAQWRGVSRHPVAWR